MNTVTLVCVDCNDQVVVGDTSMFAGVPVLTWFEERGKRCSECWQKHSARNTDPATSVKAAADVKFRSGSQRHKLLVAYSYRDNMTADEAMRAAGLSARSCYWKRVSELVDGGLLEDTGVERDGEMASAQRVNRITAEGIGVLSRMSRG